MANVADIIAGIEAGTTVTKTKKVGKGKQAAAITITRTAAAPVVVDETVQEEPKAVMRPVDTGKKRIEVLPGLALITYSRGYCVIEQKGRTYSGAKTTIRRILYRGDVKELVERLFEIGQGLKTYEEAHAGEETA